MDLLRDWRRRTFGAAAGAVIAPVAIVLAALAVGVGGGGLTGLRSIGQAVSGPGVNPVAPSAASDRDTADEAGRLLTRVRPERRRARRSGRGGAPTAGAPVSAGTPEPRRQGTVGRPRPQAQRPTAAPPAATPVRPPAQPPAATPSPSPVRQVGERVKTVTDQVPVAGEPAGEVVDLLVDTVDSLPPVLGP
jgi:hypothetical protein